MGDIINAGADLLGFGPASKQSAATRDAANISARSAADATQLQRDIFNQQQRNQAPMLAGGLAAQNRLMTLLGIGGAQTGGGGGGGGGLFGMGMPDLSGVAPSNGLNVDPNSPDYGKYARDFGMADYQADPGYQFRLSEGQRALSRGAAGRGGLVSGNSLKAMQDYAQNSASAEYGNAFNRYQTNRANQLTPIQSLMGVGQTSVNQLGQAAQNYATNAGNYGMTGGANQANAMLTQGNINASQYNTLGKGIDQLYNYGSKNNWFDSGGGSSPGTNMTQEQYAMVSGF
jgi:hypothetical protein